MALVGFNIGVTALKRGKYEFPGHGRRDDEHLEKEEVQKETDPVKIFTLYLHDIVYLLAVVILLFLLVFRVAVVSGDSMYDTLVDGDYLLLLGNLFYTQPEYGDIIVASKSDYSGGEPIVKRIIACEGQTVDIDFETGIVYVDGVALEEPYTYTSAHSPEGGTFPLTVDAGCYFVMGDNRRISKDSRSPDIGLIDRREILGKVIVLFFPGSDNGSPRDYRRIGVMSHGAG